MQMGPVGDEFDKPGRNIVQGQNVARGAKFGRGFGHAVDCTAGGILSDRTIARTAETAQSLRSVPADPGEQNSNDWPIPEALGALEEEVNRWTVSAVIRFTNVPKTPRTCEDQMCVATCHQGNPALGIVMGFGKPHAQRASAFEPNGQRTRKQRINVLDDNNRGSEIGRQST
jgi:hypothetical protein